MSFVLLPCTADFSSMNFCISSQIISNVVPLFPLFSSDHLQYPCSHFQWDTNTVTYLFVVRHYSYFFSKRPNDFLYNFKSFWCISTLWNFPDDVYTAEVVATMICKFWHSEWGRQGSYPISLFFFAFRLKCTQINWSIIPYILHFLIKFCMLMFYYYNDFPVVCNVSDRFGTLMVATLFFQCQI